MFSSKVLAILALIAALVLVAVIAAQYFEMSFYSAAPSVWPTAK